MLVVGVFSEDGEIVAFFPATSGSTPLICTETAAVALRERLAAKDGQCKRCGVIARSEELVDGICNGGVGCSNDTILLNLVGMATSKRLTEIERLMNVAIDKIIARRASEVSETPEEDAPTAPEEGGDVFKDW